MTWNPDLVERMLLEAAETLRRLPLEKPRGYFSAMPTPVRNIHEAYGWEAARLRPPPPSAAAIDRLDQVLSWMGWLSEDQVRVVWARACGVPWRPVCRRLGCGRTKAWRIWVGSLIDIAARLQAQGTPPPRLDEAAVCAAAPIR